MTKKIELLHRKQALVDDDDFNKLSLIKWHIGGGGYAISNEKGIKGKMHRFVVNARPGEIVDHINGNKLDNRKSNLRIVKHSTNIRNGKLRDNNLSGITGVNYHKARKQWRAYIMINYKHINLGWFSDKEDAIKARKKGELKYFEI